MPVPALVIIAQEFVPGAPATASGMVLGLGSALAGLGYIVLGRVQEAVGLTNGILIGFSMVVPAALIALVGRVHHRAQHPYFYCAGTGVSPPPRRSTTYLSHKPLEA